MLKTPSTLRAQPGDRLVIHGHRVGDPERDAEVLEALGADGGPPFVVRWQDDGHVSRLYPSSDVYIQHLAAPAPEAAPASPPLSAEWEDAVPPTDS
jgi:hypothetical protein